MMILQEDQTVTFNPAGLCCRATEWYEKLLAFYIFFLLILLFTRIVQLVFALFRLRRLQRQASAADAAFHAICQEASTRIDSLRRLAGFTCFIVLAEFCMGTASVFEMMATQKVSGHLAVFGAMSAQFNLTAGGFVICAALYGTSVYFKARLNRRKGEAAAKSSPRG